jgi:hypothetical protein
MAFSGYKNQRRRTAKRGKKEKKPCTAGRKTEKDWGGRTNQNRNCFPCFFSENRDEEK